MSLLRRIAIGKSGTSKNEATEVIRHIDQAKVGLWNMGITKQNFGEDTAA